ncbi:unnamed protein product (macronuclear) [Paramecium tetraurelia]|uniref:Uncharacterized protein n=1 Tax=Paramecium tetraurelia TaxID=5888 RepID=A0DBL6_PARTE|nr:uncharacterized protein GSPATT00015329001 [Paramecium tetraurelia]CAK80433.1 unnamed protein product [Paramecium tetraurelia]|eukprot:XP_001447830.1 hypothetical protein (macronuclear) [Paramecium tetraurelia strain d4-2]
MNPNIPQFKGSYVNMKTSNPLEEFSKETEQNTSSIYKLQKKLNEQQQQVDALMKVVSNSHQKYYLSQEDIYKYPIESERLNSQLLDEIKHLKKQLKQIESGPKLPQPPFLPPFFPQQQNPLGYHQPYNSIPVASPIRNQNPYYQYYPFQNTPFHQPQKEEKSFSKLLKAYAQKKQEVEKLNQLLSQLLKNQKIDPTVEHKQNSTSRRYLKVKHKQKKEISELDFSKISRFDQESPEPVKNKSNKKQVIKLQDQYSPSQNQNQKIKLEPLKVKSTQERLKKLRKKLKYCAWMVIFYKNKYYQILEKKAIKRFNDEISKYADQFLYSNTILSFVRESQKISLFKKSWVFTENKDVPNRIANLIQAADTFIKQLLIGTQTTKFDQQHLSFIRAFTTNEGYLFSDHSAFVAQRLKLNYKRNLKFTSPDQQKMAFLEYAYIYLLLHQQMFTMKGWQELLKPFAEPLKILVSLLQYLFIEKFKNLQIISKDTKFNTDKIPILDFTKTKVEDFKCIITNKDPRYQVTDKMPILGLYDETVLKPVIEHPGFATLKNQFKAYVDFIYSKVG